MILILSNQYYKDIIKTNRIPKYQNNLFYKFKVRTNWYQIKRNTEY